MAIDYSQLIPNNVDLSSDRRLQRALENWQPRFLDWWKDMGPDGTLNFDVYLRTAISAEANGWANFGYVKMPDYRWGIFLAGQETAETKVFGRLTAWQNWIFQRPNAAGPEGALRRYGTGQRADYDRKRV